MPVKPLISPARAFLYRPFGIARFAHFERRIDEYLDEIARLAVGARTASRSRR